MSLCLRSCRDLTTTAATEAATLARRVLAGVRPRGRRRTWADPVAEYGDYWLD